MEITPSKRKHQTSTKMPPRDTLFQQIIHYLICCLTTLENLGLSLEVTSLEIQKYTLAASLY